MKIKEITESNYKITQSSPQGIEIAGQDTKISLPPEKMAALKQDPSKPNIAQLDLSTTNLNQLQTTQQPQTMGQPAPGTKTNDQSGDTFSSGSQPSQQSGQPPAQQNQQNGQQPAGNQQQLELPKVGTEVELPDNIGSTMQAETFDDVDDDDLMSSDENNDIGGDAGDDFIDDVIDHDYEKNAGRSKRNIVNPEPMKESAELIAMLTIAGLR